MTLVSDCGRVVGGAGLPVAAGQPVDERPGAVPDPLAGREPVLVLLHDEHVVGVERDLGGGDHPGAAGRVALLGDLVQFLGGDEPGVGHQPLVDRAELVDAELGVGDEPAALVLALPPAALGEHQPAQHLVQGLVPQPGVEQGSLVVVTGVGDAADQPGLRRLEQVGLERLEPEPLALGQALGARVPARTVTVVDHAEQQVQRLVQVEPGSRLLADQAAGDQLAEALHAVARHVVLVVGGQDAELRACLRVQQEQDPVQVPQRVPAQLPGQVAGFRDVPGLQAVGADPVQYLVGDDLHRFAQALAELAGHPDGVLAGLVHPVGELLAAALGGWLQDVGAEQRGDRLQLGLISAVDRGVQADREVPALGPGETVGEDDDAAVQQQHVPGRLVGIEQPADELGAGRDPLVAPGLDRVEQPPGPVGVERGVGVGGPAAVDRDHVLPLVRDRHSERLARSLDVHDAARSLETQGAKHIVVLLLDGLVVGAALILGD